jgi:uncharacterized membrane protein
MLAASAWSWPQIADDARVPIHWGVDGQVDGYGPKWVGLLGIPGLALLVLGLLAVIPRIEPRRDNLERSGPAYVATGLGVMGFLVVLHGLVVMAALGSTVDTTAVVMACTGILFVVIGNYLGKTRSNWFFGIRTPWTLSSDRSWARTHRLGGWTFIAIGLLVIVASIVAGGMAAIWVMLGTLGVGVVGLVAYSYVAWRDDPVRRPTDTAS